MGVFRIALAPNRSLEQASTSPVWGYQKNGKVAFLKDKRGRFGRERPAKQRYQNEQAWQQRPGSVKS